MAGVIRPRPEWWCWWLYHWKKDWQKPRASSMEPKTIWEARAVFEGAELAFRIRIVIGDMRAAVSFEDAQISQQQRHRFGFHRRAAIGMDGESAGCDVLFQTGVFDEPLGQLGAFAVGDHPTDHLAARNIQDDVEVVSGPFHWAAQFG